MVVCKKNTNFAIDLKLTRGERQVPLFCTNITMIRKEDLQNIINDFLKDTDYQLIELTVNADNRIVVEIDNFNGVDVDFCAQLTRCIESHFDRDVEDYELEVGSSGITSPFKVLMQYQKNIGNDVEVLTRDGKKMYGQLVEAEPDHFSVDIEVKVAVEGKKRKEVQVRTIMFAYGDVKYVKYDLKI